MLVLKVLINFSFLRLLSLFVRSISLTLLHDRISVLAAGPDLRYKGPEESDYPNDDGIRESFLGVKHGKTVVFADLGRNDATDAQKCARELDKTFIYDAFPNSYLFRNGRSPRWYSDFIERVTRVWLGAASGVVFLVTNYPDGPSLRPSCKLWWFIELPLLKLNEKVRVIARVNRKNCWMKNVYLDKDEKDPFDPNKRGSGDLPRLPGGNGGSIFGAGIGAGGLMGGLGVGAGARAGQELVHGLYLPLSGGDGSNDETYNGDGVKTDVLGNIIGFLPSENPPTVTDEQHATVDINGASDASGIFKRQSTPVCYDWSDIPDFPTFPGDPRLTTYFEGVPDPQYFDMAQGGWALIQVTQYAKIFPLLQISDDYKLDLWIRNPANNNQLLGSVVSADAPKDQQIQVVSLLPFALYVWTGATDDDPLHFRYGELEWDSNDDSDDHKCVFGAWTTEKREGTCKLHYG